jgi:hypothetical protein
MPEALDISASLAKVLASLLPLPVLFGRSEEAATRTITNHSTHPLISDDFLYTKLLLDDTLHAIVVPDTTSSSLCLSPSKARQPRAGLDPTFAMFRFFRPRKTLFSTARLPMRLETMRQNGQLQNVQRVRFQKPGFRWKYALPNARNY